MNHWTERSIILANNDCYLDQLFTVYPIQPNPLREIDENTWTEISHAFNNNDNNTLIDLLLDLDLFPIKDPYIRYLKRDRESVQRNPQTVERLTTEIRNFTLEELRNKCSEPKETNRQMGPLFNNWISNSNLGLETFTDINLFENGDGNRCFIGTDEQKKDFVRRRFNHRLPKGFDFLAVYNGRFVLGEAKLITDFGGHQQVQFDDAMRLISTGIDAVCVAILDGVIYINEGNNKMQNEIRESDSNIMSALLLGGFLESL